MSTLYRLRFLDLSITWWVILALNGLAAGCGGADIRMTRADGSDGVNLTQTPEVFDSDPRWLPVP
jgi:hypothetical protein